MLEMQVTFQRAVSVAFLVLQLTQTSYTSQTHFQNKEA